MGGVVYEVNLKIDKSAVEEFKTWMIGHMTEMLTFDGFVSAELSVMDDDADGRAQLCAEYHLSSRDKLQEYYEKHAGKMRADGQERFKDKKFHVSRTTRDVIFTQSN